MREVYELFDLIYRYGSFDAYQAHIQRMEYKKGPAPMSWTLEITGRGEKIWTSDLLVPNQAR